MASRGSQLVAEWQNGEHRKVFTTTCETCRRPNTPCAALLGSDEYDYPELHYHCLRCIRGALETIEKIVPVGSETSICQAAVEVARRHRLRPCSDPGSCSICVLAKVVYGES